MKKLTITTAFLLCAVLITNAQWTYTNLSDAKIFMGSAALGKNAYFAGGSNGSEYLTRVEVYNVDSGQVDTLPGGLSVAREIIGGGISCGTKVFFPGGFDWNTSFSTVDIYDTMTRQWTVEQLSESRFSLSAVSHGNQVLFAGGFQYPQQVYKSVVDIYNIETGEWTTTNLSLAREGMAAAVVGDLALFAGGKYGSNSTTNIVDVYDFSDNSWSTMTLSQARGFASAVTIGSKVIIAGGITSLNNPSNRVDIYDASTGTWTTANLSTPRSSQGNGANVCGKAFFAGGGTFYGSGFNNPSDVVDIYDPASNSWSVDELINERVEHSVLGIGGYLIVAGGQQGSNQLLSGIEIYHDPTLIQVPGNYASIQDAINAASDGDTVLVYNGTYYENINLLGRKPFMLASHYLMDGDTNHINNTIINGSQPVDPEIGTAVTFGPGSDTTTILCGFSVTGGTGTYNGAFRGGGGVVIGEGGGKLLSNHIEYNEIYYDYWTMGGGILTGGPGITPMPCVVLRGNRICHNKAISATDEGDGGGIDSWYNLIMENNEVSWNEAEGPYRGDGGGVRIRADFGHLDLVIRNNDIIHNKAKSVSASTDMVLTGGLSIFLDCSGIISGNNISYNAIEVADNKWGYGTGILIDKNDPEDLVLENNLIEGNTFTGRYLKGGGLCIWQSSCLLQNNIIRDNTGSDGGGIFVHTPADQAVMINNTITGNTADYGGGIFALNADVISLNNIVWDNTATTTQGHSIKTDTYSSLIIQYSDIEDETVWPGEGNINADPLFNEDGMHICETSPCTNFGAESVTISDVTYYAPLYDFDGNPRPWSTGFDMGADECDIFTGMSDQGKEAGSQQSAVIIYPNPTTGKFQITSTIRQLADQTNPKNQNTNSTVEIVDYLGNSIEKWNMEHGTGNMELDISNFPAGIYFIRINADNVMSTSKIIKL